MNAPARDLKPAAAAVTVAATPALPKFIHLKVHSAYSLLEGALPIPTLAKMAEKYGHPAIALTDTNNMFGVLEASEKLSGSGIQPIAGVSLSIDFQDKKPERRNPGGSLVRPLPHKDGLIALYAMTEEGYSNLMQLVSKAHLESPDTEGPHITIADLATRAAGIIALTGGPDGPIDRVMREGQDPIAESRLSTLLQVFGDRLYVEIQRHGLKTEAAVEPRLLDLTASRRLALAAEASGVMTVLLRASSKQDASAARTRWQVSALPSQALESNAPGNPAFSLRLLRHRGGLAEREWRVEWDRDRQSFQEPSAFQEPSGFQEQSIFPARAVSTETSPDAAPLSRSVVSFPADRPAAAGAQGSGFRQAG